MLTVGAMVLVILTAGAMELVMLTAGVMVLVMLTAGAIVLVMLMAGATVLVMLMAGAMELVMLIVAVTAVVTLPQSSEASSLPSKQSASPSHTQVSLRQPPLAHWNSYAKSHTHPALSSSSLLSSQSTK